MNKLSSRLTFYLIKPMIFYTDISEAFTLYRQSLMYARTCPPQIEFGRADAAKAQKIYFFQFLEDRMTTRIAFEILLPYENKKYLRI